MSRSVMSGVVKQLPSGRHGLDPRVVRENQLRRLLDATAEVLCERGYDACSITAVTTRAGVSRKTFYEFFSGRADAVQAAVERDRLTEVPTGIAELDRGGWRLVREVA